MARLLLALVVSGAALHAAVVRGIVVENQTGRPLMRARVTLVPVARGAKELSARTDRYGNFAFGAPDGRYVLRASRRGFMPAEYGQRQWNSAGIPFQVRENEATFLRIAMRRYGAVAGTVRDENDVGRAEWRVLAYRNTQPPQMAADAVCDERGRFRISGLTPGLYLVRSAPMIDDDLSFLPTFGNETLQPSNARVFRVLPDEDSRDAEVRPVAGKLFSVSGTVYPEVPGVPTTITLVSELGRQTRQGIASVFGLPFEFTALPPGDYEIYAEGREVRGVSRLQAVYSPLRLLQDASGLSLQMRPISDTYFFTNPRLPNSASLVVLARRKDLAGLGETQEVKLTASRATLAPGRWEFLLAPPDGYYVSGFGGNRPWVRERRPDGWNEAVVGPPRGTYSISYTLSAGPGSIHGVVASGGDVVPGAPVHLEGYDPSTRERTLDLQTVTADANGAYRFENLAPGEYRILATFEYLAPDVDEMGYAGARQLRVQARADAQLNLDLYGQR